MYITSDLDGPQESLPDTGRDKINADMIDALPQPIMARMAGGGEWEIIDVEVECAIFRANIGGLPQVMSFCEIMQITDGDGNTYDPEIFWMDYQST